MCHSILLWKCPSSLLSSETKPIQQSSSGKVMPHVNSASENLSQTSAPNTANVSVNLYFVMEGSTKMASNTKKKHEAQVGWSI